MARKILLKLVKSLRTAFLALAALVLVAFAAFVAPLFFAEAEIPRSWIDAAERAVSTSNLCVSVRSASIKLPEGVRLKDVRVFELAREKPAAIVSADAVDVKLSFLRLAFDRNAALKRVSIRGLDIPRMPAKWYEPIVDRHESYVPLSPRLTKMRPFTVEVFDANILGAKVESLRIDSVAAGPDEIAADGVSIKWPDPREKMALSGALRFDLAAQVVSANVSGMAKLSEIRPLVEALDATGALEYFDAVTGLDEPIPVTAKITGNTANDDFSIAVNLKTPECSWRGVPMKSLSGEIDVDTRTRGTFYNLNVALKNLEATGADGAKTTGSVVYSCSNNVECVEIDAKSGFRLRDLAAAARILDNGELDSIADDTAPEIVLKGRAYIDPDLAAGNAMSGTISLDKGSIAGVRLENVRSPLVLDGTRISFPSAEAQSTGGGRCKASVVIDVPRYSAADSRISISGSGEKVPLPDVASALRVDAGDRYGTVDFNADVAMPLSGNMFAGLDGSGRVECKNGHIAQMPLFAGFTGYIAHNVPGVSRLVDQSDGSFDFTIEKGVLHSENVLVEGDVFSIRGKGSLDIVRSRLDFTVRATIFRKESFVGLITSPVTWTFTKLLLEFRVHGPFEKPEWESLTIFDRAWNAIAGGKETEENEESAGPDPRQGDAP